MVSFQGAEKFFHNEEPIMHKTDNLMKKYNIPVEHLDFHYIETCNDGRELEKIVQILRSGEEGYYPDLLKATEKRLILIKPKSKLLKKSCPVLKKEALTKEENNEINEDLKQWVNHISKNDNKLGEYKNMNVSKSAIPIIRQNTEIVINENKKLEKKISSTDYSSWDKYDVDTEIMKMELEDEKQKKIVETNKNKKQKKVVKFQKFTTDVEAEYQAIYEKDKGNEFFKTGDYKEALKHYNNSIACKPTVPGYTNRAITHLKLKQFKFAYEDCRSALALDPNNFKALLRKAQALDGLGQFNEALNEVEKAIYCDPNNTIAQELAQNLREKSGVILKNTKMKIEDKEKKPIRNNKKTNEMIIPIPGTSTMPPPHFVICSDKSEKITEKAIRTNTPSILHLVPIDKIEAEEDDCCTINHLTHICNNKSNFKALSDVNNKKNKDKEVNSIDDFTREDCKSEFENNINNKPLKVELNIKNRVEKNTNGKIENVDKNKLSYNRRNNDLNSQFKTDKQAGGEPCVKQKEAIDIPQDIHSPFSFLKAWNSAGNDSSLEHYAKIIKMVDMNRIVAIIGCKLDNAMFTNLIRCLCMHFTVPGQVDKLNSILQNIVNVPRFDIITLLMSEDDKRNISLLVDFLKQHEKHLPKNVLYKLNID